MNTVPCECEPFDLVPVFFYGFIMLCAFIVWVFSRMGAKQRAAEVTSWVEERGYPFDGRKHKLFKGPAKWFAHANAGSTPIALNTFRVTIDVFGHAIKLRAGDMRYSVQAGRSRTTYHYSYILLELPLTGVPGLRIRPESITDMAKSALGFDDIDFEDAAFSDRYHVSSTDKRFVYDLLDPRMMELLKTASLKTMIECSEDRLMLSPTAPRNGRFHRWSPEEFDRRIAFLEAFFAHWPEHVVRSLREKSEA